ncbi:hypothetical protein BGX28_007099 [Mortierella sp. GBA30]|nr:hypothetical protein BGX28_007099 [Mortierella sp. GBA30]
MNTPRQRDIISNVDQRTSSGSNHILTQTIAHRIGDECLVFEVPVLTKESTGDRFVLLQPILDVFPETVALRRSDKSPVQFLTTEDDLLATFPRSHMGPTATAQRHQRDDGRERARDVKDEKDIDLHNCIHVAEQPGYEVLNLAQFSEQFGEYALCLLRTLKYGVDTTQSRGCISQARIAVPSLTQSNYTDVLQPFTWEIVERVSFAIETLERMARTRQSAMTDETSVGSIDVSRLWECVDGLKSWGEYRVHFMRRMFVHDGTIRWICDRHFESTFEYTKEDRDLLLWRCREILGDDCSIDVGDEIGTLAEEADTLLNMSSSATQTAQEVTNEVSSVPTKPVSFDDREMHLTLSGLTSKEQIVQLASVLQTDAYMVQQVTLISRVSTEPLSMAIIDMMSKSKIPLWRVVFPPGARTKIGHGSTTTLFTGLMPDPGDFPHLRRLHLWGSDTLGNYLAVREREASDISPWNHVGLGSLVRAFSNLTDLRITGIFLGNSSPTAFSTSTASDPPVLEIAQSLLYLPKLAVLEISCCGLLKEHCALLSRSLSLLDNRITHLDVHNNWLEDEGLAELIWAAGPRLYSLDARNCGFGNASAFALMSMLQSHEQQNRRDLEDDGLVSQMAIYRVLKLEETCHPHKVLWPRKAEALTRTTFLKNSGTVNDLDEHGRQNMIRALELLEPMELGLSFELGFRDQDFASAFAGMKKLECLERLQVSHSNFGPLAVEAMLRTLRTTSCRIRELGIQSTLLTEEEQRATLDQILNI